MLDDVEIQYGGQNGAASHNTVVAPGYQHNKHVGFVLLFAPMSCCNA